MSTNPKMHDRLPENKHDSGLTLITQSQFRVIVALILIALGGVFLLGQSKRLDYGSSWWVIFILIPGIVFLWAAFMTYQQVHHFNSLTAIQIFLGVAAVILSVIFIVDPHWSFTQNWNLDKTFPFLHDVVWNRVWPWFLVLLGAGILYSAYRQRSFATGFVGGALIVVGAVFILNISWDVVWPLAIVAVGFGLLFVYRPSRNEP